MAGSIIGGVFGKMAADEQADAAKRAEATQMQMFERSIELSEPWRVGGQNALAALQYELGLGALPSFGGTTTYSVGDRTFDTREEAERYRNSLGGAAAGAPEVLASVGMGRESGPRAGTFGQRLAAPGGAAGPGGAPGITEQTGGGFEYTGFRETPGYGFLLDEGQKAIDRSLAARGKLLSGEAVKEGMRFSQGLADQTYSNHLARLAQVAGVGSGVAQQQGAFATQAGSNIAQAQQDLGAARASGYGAIGQGLGGSINFLGGLAGRTSLFG